MEKVFWLMWLADIVGSISIIGVVATISMGVGLMVLIVVIAVEGMDEGIAIIPRAWKVMRWALIPVVVGVFTPNPKTIQVLAVASAADALATTQIGAKSIQALNAVLDRVIAGANPKK